MMYVIRNCYKALKKDGFLFITVPQHAWLWSSVDEKHVMQEDIQK